MFFLARLMFDDGNSYYGDSQLIFFNLIERKTHIMVSNNLNMCCVFSPVSFNPNGTQIVVTSAKNPCTLTFTFVTH